MPAEESLYLREYSMHIRQWKEQDLNQIISLLHEMEDTLEEDQKIEYKNVYNHFQAMEQQKDTYENYVLVLDEKVIGFMSILFYRSIYHQKGTAQINELVVSKDYRNQGLGKQLLQFGIKIAKERGMDEIEIGVSKDNKKALDFYKRNGIDEEYVLLGKEFI